MINRQNYETYFILYLDNELSPAMKAEVDAFALANPDLAEELDLLMDTKLMPDNTIEFSHKNTLIRSEEAEHFQHQMLLQVDNELNSSDQETLAEWLRQNPSRQRELSALMLTKLQADTSIVFPDKDLLYKHEEKTVVVRLQWRKWAIAASILLTFGTGIFFLTRTQKELPAIAGELNIETKIPENSSHKNETVLPEQPSTPSEQFVAVNENDLAIKDEQNKKASVVNQKMETPLINNPNQLPDASKNPNVLLAAADISTTNNTDYASADFNNLKRPVTPFTDTKEIIYTPTVTSNALQPLQPIYAAQEYADIDEPVKQNKARGFLRKVTRTIEKTTKIKTTDSDDRLLIGALAIQL